MRRACRCTRQDPLLCVAMGSGKCLEEFDIMKKVVDFLGGSSDAPGGIAMPASSRPRTNRKPDYPDSNHHHLRGSRHSLCEGERLGSASQDTKTFSSILSHLSVARSPKIVRPSRTASSTLLHLPSLSKERDDLQRQVAQLRQQGIKNNELENENL